MRRADVSLGIGRDADHLEYLRRRRADEALADALEAASRLWCEHRRRVFLQHRIALGSGPVRQRNAARLPLLAREPGLCRPEQPEGGGHVVVRCLQELRPPGGR